MSEQAKQNMTETIAQLTAGINKANIVTEALMTHIVYERQQTNFYREQWQKAMSPPMVATLSSTDETQSDSMQLISDLTDKNAEACKVIEQKDRRIKALEENIARSPFRST